MIPTTTEHSNNNKELTSVLCQDNVQCIRRLCKLQDSHTWTRQMEQHSACSILTKRNIFLVRAL